MVNGCVIGGPIDFHVWNILWECKEMIASLRHRFISAIHISNSIYSNNYVKDMQMLIKIRTSF